jgi:hypothetical protein
MRADATPDQAESCLWHVLRDKRKLWTVFDLAEELTVTPNHVYELIGSGDLEAHYFGKRRKGYGSENGNDLFPVKPDRRAGTRITRRSVIAYLIRSADYDLSAEELTTATAAIIGDLPTAAVKALGDHCASVLARRDRL